MSQTRPNGRVAAASWGRGQAATVPALTILALNDGYRWELYRPHRPFIGRPHRRTSFWIQGEDPDLVISWKNCRDGVGNFHDPCQLSLCRDLPASINPNAPFRENTAAIRIHSARRLFFCSCKAYDCGVYATFVSQLTPIYLGPGRVIAATGTQVQTEP